MGRLLIVCFMIFVLWRLTGGSDSVSLQPGIKIIVTALQKTIEEPKPPEFQDYILIPLADFKL